MVEMHRGNKSEKCKLNIKYFITEKEIKNTYKNFLSFEEL